MSPILQLFRRLARYNTLANRCLYEACAALSDQQRKADRKAFFGSIHGTLNHLLIGDRIWLARLEGGAAPSTGLDGVPFEDFAALHESRQQEDQRLEAYAVTLTEADLARQIDYTNNEGRSFSDPVSLALPHLFNHQTHHRGQVHDMLSQIGPNPLVLDMHRVLKPDPGSDIAAA